jgi:O-antigen/teichoic acid export membrane protein
MGVTWALVLALYDVPAAGAALRETGEARRPRLDRAAAARLVAISFPLGLVVMLISLRVNVPRYFLERWVGAAGLGTFAAVASLLVAGALVVNALGQAATPRLAALHLAGERGAFRALVLKLLAVACALGVAGVVIAAVAGEPILSLLFGARFSGQGDLLVLLMAAGVPAYAASILGFALTAARRFKVQLPVFAGTTAVCAALCLWLVPTGGLRGAALAWGGAMALEAAAIGVLLALALRPARAGRRSR